MPITAADAALPGVPDYIAEAVALAVNDAYRRTPAARSAFSPNRFQLMEYSNYLNEIDKVGPSAALSAFREKLTALEAVTDKLTDENEKLSKLSGGRGSCVVFFTKVRASCMFSGDRLALYELYLQPLSGDQREETSLDAGELYDRLYQATLPLNAADYTDSSLPEYLTQAIVIAVNQAYEQSLRQ